MSDSDSSEQTEIILEFVNEARELIDELEPAIIDLEKMAGKGDSLSSQDIEVLNSIFRLFHSIKGGAGFLHFNNIVTTTHTAESLLDRIRTRDQELLESHVDLLCLACDFLKEALGQVEENLDDHGMSDQAQVLLDKFVGLENGEGGGDVSEPQSSPASMAQPPAGFETEPASAPAPPPQSPPSPSLPPDIKLEISMADLVTPETRKKFLEEADDLHQEIEEDLLTLAGNAANLEPVERLFRNIHSFKGNCGFLGFNNLEQLAHTEETLLDTVKTGQNKSVGKVADMLLELIDVHKGALTDIAGGGSGDIQGLELYLELLNNLLPKEQQDESLESSTKIGDILVKQGAVSRDEVDKALDVQSKTLGELLVDSGSVRPEQVDKALEVQEKIRPKTGGAAGRATAKRQDIRVDLEKLDKLIDLIGEMVIAENMVIHNPDLTGLELENFNKAGQHMAKIVRELQEMAMIIRMVPVSGLFRRMIRLVHDLSRKSGKKTELILSGETTEVDKTVIEKITDPMVHLIRNAMDHGLEDAAGRQAAGKPETGNIELSASHQEGEVVITIRDDGRGMDRNQLLAKGIERGLVEGDGASLSDQQVFQLIFQPGFSTAEAVTDISGRGVGMDVVRQNLEAIKGRIDIDSILGQGSTITLHIPLTLAIIDGMQVRTGDANYILPILSIRESFQPAPEAITVSPDGQELVRVREHLLPVVRLHELHGVTPDHLQLEKGILVVLETRGERNVCLFVDELMGQQQTVIKSLSDYLTKLGDVSGVSGCTILGNGEVCLILDVRAIEEVLDREEMVQEGLMRIENE